MMTRGIRVLMITSGEERCGIREYSKYLTEELSRFANVTIFYFNRRNNIASYQNILKLVLREKYDIIHIQHEFALFDKLYGITFLLFIPILYLISKLLNTRLIITLHSVFPLNDLIVKSVDPKWTQNSLLLVIVKMYLYSYLRLLCLFFDKCIALTPAGKVALKEEYRVNPDKLVYIPHGVPPISLSDVEENEVVAFRRRLGLENSFIISLVGFAYKTKGYQYVIRSLPTIISKLHNVKLVIAGGIPSSGYKQARECIMSLMNEIKKYRVTKNVVITGYLPLKELKYLFIISDAFVFPYQYRINASGMVNMVVNSRKPLIVSNIPLFKELLRYNAALAVNPEDPQQLAEAILSVLQNPKLRERLADGIRKYIINYNMKNVAKLHVRLYMSLLR